MIDSLGSSYDGTRNMKKRQISYRPIGQVKNDFDNPDHPACIKATVSQLIIDKGLEAGLNGLTPGKKLMVIFHLHRSQGYELTQHPRGDKKRPKRGVFTLRSPQRPNPIGVTVVDLTVINHNILTVRGLDALNDSPILDLKPA
jgi:tRNA-Thr(GGU) m(6)t(6)A37 methyltransferase TsaA